MNIPKRTISVFKRLGSGLSYIKGCSARSGRGGSGPPIPPRRLGLDILETVSQKNHSGPSRAGIFPLSEFFRHPKNNDIASEADAITTQRPITSGFSIWNGFTEAVILYLICRKSEKVVRCPLELPNHFFSKLFERVCGANLRLDNLLKEQFCFSANGKLVRTGKFCQTFRQASKNKIAF